jgi:hypothetical protein
VQEGLRQVWLLAAASLLGVVGTATVDIFLRLAWLRRRQLEGRRRQEQEQLPGAGASGGGPSTSSGGRTEQD